MNFYLNEILEKVLEKLDELQSDFQENKGIILTEHDLQCLLFHKLYDLFTHDKETDDIEIKGSPLHCEIPFFDEERKLRLRPDIAIIDPKGYSIIHSIEDRYKETPSKEFSFYGDAIVIELKFCRAKRGITKIEGFENDFEKIKKIKGMNSNNRIYGIVAIFNKTDKRSKIFDEFRQEAAKFEPDIKVRYYTGNIKI